MTHLCADIIHQTEKGPLPFYKWPRRFFIINFQKLAHYHAQSRMFHLHTTNVSLIVRRSVYNFYVENIFAFKYHNNKNIRIRYTYPAIVVLLSYFWRSRAILLFSEGYRMHFLRLFDIRRLTMILSLFLFEELPELMYISAIS